MSGAMPTITVSIDVDGTMRQLTPIQGTPEALDVPVLVDGITKRASYVEPANTVLRCIFHALRIAGDTSPFARASRRMRCAWRINLSPINGPVLPVTYRDRSQAINAEITWLTRNWL